MPKQILVLKPQNFLTFICLPASLIDFHYVGDNKNKSFGEIAGTDEALKLGNKYFLSKCFGIDDYLNKSNIDKVIDKSDEEVITFYQVNGVADVEGNDDETGAGKLDGVEKERSKQEDEDEIEPEKDGNLQEACFLT